MPNETTGLLDSLYASLRANGYRIVDRNRVQPLRSRAIKDGYKVVAHTLPTNRHKVEVFLVEPHDLTTIIRPDKES